MANNCKAVFVNNTPLVCTVTDNGDGTYTFNNHIDPPVTWSTGGADTDTSIVFNQVLPNGDWEFNVVDVLTNTVLTTFTVPAPTISIIDNGDNTFTYIDVAGNPTVIAYEHTLVDNNDGTFTFTQPDGTPTTIDVCKLQQDSGCAATMVDNGDGTYTYTDINGVSTTFTGGVANVLTTITNTVIGHKIADYTDENGGVTPIYETITTIVNNGDGTATFTNEDGIAITFPIGGVSIVDNTDGTYLVTLADGSTITIGDTSISTLVDNGDNTYTYTDETGVATTFDVTGVLTTVTNTIVGNKIADYTDEAGGVTPINESITNFASITNGWQFTSEDGTVYPFTFTFDNSTPSAPQLLVNYGATIVATIPLNSYDVNITTTGGFALNPLTDVITITETDGETHTIDLSYLRSTLTSTDGSVEIVTSINPDGSTNYDLGVKCHSNETQAVPYTGVELPLTNGVNIGDTNSTQFSDGTVVNYNFDGTTWVVDFMEEPETLGTITMSDEDGNTFIQDNNANAIFPLDRTLHVKQGTVGSLAIGVSSQDSDQTATGNITNNHRNVVSGSTLSSAAGDNNMVTASTYYSEIYGGSENFIAANRSGWLLPTDTKTAIIASQNSPSSGNNAWSANIGGAYNSWSNVKYSIVSGSSNVYNNVADGSFVSGFANIQSAGQIQSALIVSRYNKINNSIGGSFIAGSGVAGRETELNGSIAGSFITTSTTSLATLPTRLSDVYGSLVSTVNTRHIGSLQYSILLGFNSEITSPVTQESTLNIADSNIDGSIYNSALIGANINTTANINQSVVFGKDHNVISNIFGSNISGIGTNVNNSGVLVFNSSSSQLSTNLNSKGYFGLPNGMDITTNNAHTLGVSVAPNGTSWASISDKNKKENFKKVNYATLLSKFNTKDINIWNYKTDNTKHIGITAQDFYDIVGNEIGSDNLKIETIDADGLSLALIKGLIEEVNSLKLEIKKLSNQIK